MYSRERDRQENRKAAKKLRRKQALFLKEEPRLAVSFVDAPSQSIFIGNGGLLNGLSREVMARLLGGKLQELYMPVGKDYAFANFDATSSAAAAVELLNGACIQELCRRFELWDMLGQPVAKGPPLHLYVCYVESFPGGESAMTGAAASEVPPGLIIAPEFISDAEESCFLDFFSISSRLTIDQKREATCTAMTSGVTCNYSQKDGSGAACGITCSDPEDKMENPFPEDNSLCVSTNTETRPPQATLKHRRVLHYGYEFLYASSNVDPDSPLPGGLPSVCTPMLERIVDSKLVSQIPDQLTVNEYPPGAGGYRTSLVPRPRTFPPTVWPGNEASTCVTVQYPCNLVSTLPTALACILLANSYRFALHLFLGIPPHVDTHSAFMDGIMSVSLGSSVSQFCGGQPTCM